MGLAVVDQAAAQTGPAPEFTWLGSSDGDDAAMDREELAALAAELFVSDDDPVTASATNPLATQTAAQPAPETVSAESAQTSPSETQVALGLPDPGDPAGGILSELRLGLLYHDVGIVSESTEEGADVNFEALFASPGFLEIIFSPRPHLGVSINTAGDTSQVYGGLTWALDLWGGLFVEFAFGGSVHDGELDANRTDKNDLGCRILFREALELGWRFGGHHSISVMADHISNAGFCSDNDGQDTAGIRYGYKF